MWEAIYVILKKLKNKESVQFLEEMLLSWAVDKEHFKGLSLCTRLYDQLKGAIKSKLFGQIFLSINFHCFLMVAFQLLIILLHSNS